MSRTKRFRKGNHIPWWNDYEWSSWVEIEDYDNIDPSWDIRIYHGYARSYWERKVTGKEAKKIYWKMHKDQKFNFKEPGPHWWRNFFDRGHRRKAKRELQKFMSNNEYEPMIDRKPVLDYWT